MTKSEKEKMNKVRSKNLFIAYDTVTLRLTKNSVKLTYSCGGERIDCHEIKIGKDKIARIAKGESLNIVEKGVCHRPIAIEDAVLILEKDRFLRENAK